MNRVKSATLLFLHNGFLTAAGRATILETREGEHTFNAGFDLTGYPVT
jgi:hypothetical protein